jgi:maltooligosyltrehalose trehalohydrolase
MSRNFRHAMPFGSHVTNDGVRFRLYAPAASRVEVVLDAGEREQRAPLQALGGGWFEATLAQARAGTRYAFVLDGAETRVPDPASRFQPDGVHGASEVIDPLSFPWPDETWHGRPWSEHVFYELHLGTFTPEGTYAAARGKLGHLAELGITAIELMPLAEVPGARNWGYDGVLPYAPTRNYGTPDELKAFIADAHGHGLAVYLDVVYNHFGPEGNYLHGYAPTFYTERHKTPWGAAIDVEAPERDAVRAFFIETALYWTQEYRFDGLRFDAVHAIYDGADRHFLRELARTVAERSDRPVHLVLENELNEAPLLEAGFRAQWDDDEHHVMHVLATNERDGYYADYAKDTVALFGRTLTQGFAYQGEFSEHAGKVRGTPSARLPLGDFVVFLQNHDQIGNRPFGDRITAVAPDFAVRALLATFLLAPSPPLLFMGEEWAASTPFQFFCDFEPELARAVTEGRRSEFGSFAAFSDPEQRDRIPDPSAVETFERSKLAWDELAREPHRAWLDYYRRLLAIRRDEIAPRIADVTGSDASFEPIGAYGLSARFRLSDGATLVLEANFGGREQAGFRTLPSGYVVFSTHDPTYSNSVAPPWSVRWTLD